MTLMENIVAEIRAGHETFETNSENKLRDLYLYKNSEKPKRALFLMRREFGMSGLEYIDLTISEVKFLKEFCSNFDVGSIHPNTARSFDFRSVDSTNTHRRFVIHVFDDVADCGHNHPTISVSLHLRLNYTVTCDVINFDLNEYAFVKNFLDCFFD